MMSSWTWVYQDATGTVVDRLEPAPEFASQADAESWVGEYWRDLAEQGVEAVTLVHQGGTVYGPMPLQPAG